MKPKTLRLLGIGLGLVGLLVLGVQIPKTITLEIDGEATSYQTLAFTVGGFLRLQSIPIGESDAVAPDLGTWLGEGSRIRINRAYPVTILDGAERRDLFTTGRLPANLLAEAGVLLYPGDEVLAGGKPVDPAQPLEAGPVVLSVRHAILARLGDGTELASRAATLGQALWEAGYRVRLGDRISSSLGTPLAAPGKAPGEALEVQWMPARLITIRAGEQRATILTAARTVGEALAEAGLPLQGLDYSRPAEGEPLPADGKIRVVRVEEKVTLEQTPLQFETEFQPASEVEIDQQQIIQAGEYGLTAHRVRARYENGEEVSRQVEGEWVARQPVHRIVGYGTKIVKHTLQTADGKIEYWRAVRMWATSYHPSEVGDTTASGLPLKKGVAAVDTRYVPFFTQMYVEGYGKAVAADIGGGVIGRWIDLGYSDNDYKSWHSWVTVYFLWPPPENIVWVIP